MCEIDFVLMKRSAADSDVGGEGSERGSASAFVAFDCAKCGQSRSGSSYIWSHGGWCLHCVQQFRREQEAERLRQLAAQPVQKAEGSK